MYYCLLCHNGIKVYAKFYQQIIENVVMIILKASLNEGVTPLKKASLKGSTGEASQGV